MEDSWHSAPQEIKDFVHNHNRNIKGILNGNYAGLYLHGSLAMGGFNPKSSDIDILVITEESMGSEVKRELIRLFLRDSNSPYPIEVSFICKDQLRQWQYPCPFDFHYSEFWRERYTEELLNGTAGLLNSNPRTDADLAAHITIIHSRGICIEGASIGEVFPLVPRSDYLSSILADYQECLLGLEKDPIYCSLNLIRVYWYAKEGVISSKQEAGIWAIKEMPKEIGITIKKVLSCYSDTKDICRFDQSELARLREYIEELMQAIR
ncbi:hypothetical protein CYL18_06930 [Pradoshia eiseniae]|uniref:Spectinomycin 9-adenylyltransferase n=1 Tax=Pradoshia eiseniae TaxID=2064768 RepID=A0A2S7N0L0_9BACI|nr:aminoglycoside adenylyltransferase domain-containing protein [Pradoshia eiseniae]PQD95622.1 hypothetical protein CYL18_06930 [Pradoshia eiseniae]